MELNSIQSKVNITIPSDLTIETNDLEEAIQQTKVMRNLNTDPYLNMSTIQIFKDLIIRQYHNVPTNAKKMSTLLAVYFIIWTVLGTVDYKGIYRILVFLTASYNNFIGKFFYLIGVLYVIIPMYYYFKKGSLTDYFRIYKNAIYPIPRIIQQWKLRVVGPFLVGMGLMISFSNLLTRNNKVDKYLVCVLLALTLLKSLGETNKKMFFGLLRSLIHDVLNILRFNNEEYKNYDTLFIVGGALGLLLSYFIPKFGSTSYSDPKGYVIGLIVFALGILFGGINKYVGAQKK